MIQRGIRVGSREIRESINTLYEILNNLRVGHGLTLTRNRNSWNISLAQGNQNQQGGGAGVDDFRYDAAGKKLVLKTAGKTFEIPLKTVYTVGDIEPTGASATLRAASFNKTRQATVVFDSDAPAQTQINGAFDLQRPQQYPTRTYVNGLRLVSRPMEPPALPRAWGDWFEWGETTLIQGCLYWNAES